MIFQRDQFIAPGHDDIYDECRHDPKRDHGIDADDVVYFVRTELPDGRRAVLSLEVSSDRFPATIPPAHFGLGEARASPDGRHTLYGRPARATDLSLHVQPIAGMKGGECGVMPQGVQCVVAMTTALGADLFYNEHGNPESAFEQPETFWAALERRLEACIADKLHLPQPEYLSADDIVSMLTTKWPDADIEIKRHKVEARGVWTLMLSDGHGVPIAYTTAPSLRMVMIAIYAQVFCS